jgi:hypothetical protein
MVSAGELRPRGLRLVQTWNLDPENSVVPSGCDSADVSVFGKDNRPFETAVTDFHCKESHCFEMKCQAWIISGLRLRRSAMAPNPQTLWFDGKVDVLGFYAG